MRIPVTICLVVLLIGCTIKTEFQLWHWRDSHALYRQALRIDPDNFVAHNNLGRILYHEGKVSQAMEHFYAALRRNPYSAPPNVNLGDIFLMNRQAERAIEFYSKALKGRQEVEYAHCGLARAYLALGNNTKAIEHYTKALTIKPEMIVANINLASILATHPDPKTRDANRAIPLAERACQFSQEPRPEFMSILAAAYAEKGRFTEAVKVVEKALPKAERLAQGNVLKTLNEQLLAYRSGKTWDMHSLVEARK